MNNNVDYIQICVACCQINKYNKKTLPFICPRTGMPCFAIKPDRFDSPERVTALILYLKQFNPDEDDSEKFRMPMNCSCIDQINSRVILKFRQIKRQTSFAFQYCFPQYFHLRQQRIHKADIRKNL